MRMDLLPVTFDGKVTRLIEECSELVISLCKLQKSLCKLQRFGEKPTDPLTGVKYDNITDMYSEMEDVEHAINEIRIHLRGR